MSERSHIQLVCHILVANHNGRLERATDARIARQEHLRKVREYAHNGKVAVVWSGRDCDGVQYSGQVCLVDATVQAVDEHINHTYEWADGPCYFYLAHPIHAERIQYASRDLTLEAFEDGHPHVLYS